jgi:hypothetical protein
MNEIIETVIKVCKHVENLRGDFYARVIIHPHEIVSVEVDYGQVPSARSGGFSVSTHRSELERLQRELEWMLDHFFGPEWRKAEGGEGNVDGIIEALLRAQKYAESRVGYLKAVITIYRQSVDIQVEVTMMRKRRLKTQRFGISKFINKPDDLLECLEMMLDIYLGTAWREQE